METSNEYEKKWWKEGRRGIIGLDEAGRGPIAGPLVVAAVMFPVDYHHETIYDSMITSFQHLRITCAKRFHHPTCHFLNRQYFISD